MSAPEPARALAPLLPPLALGAGLACLAGAAGLTNCAALTALLSRSINGLYAIIAQLAVADLLLLLTTIGPEMWSYNERTWSFGQSGCVMFQGLKVFASTASLYLVATVALHAIATVNLEEKTAYRAAKRNDHDEDDEIRSSQHSLVATSDTSTPPRTMNVDYQRLTASKIPVTRPTVFVWVLCASLSVPEFTLASSVQLDGDIHICTLVDSNHKFYMNSLITLFSMFLPMFIMTTAFAIIVVKLKRRKLLREINDELVPTLKLSLGLIVVSFVLCTPRSIVNAYTVYSEAITECEVDSLLEAVRRSQPTGPAAAVTLVCCGAYLAATLIRPILCIALLPSLRKKFTFRRRASNIENV